MISGRVYPQLLTIPPRCVSAGTALPLGNARACRCGMTSGESPAQYPRLGIRTSRLVPMSTRQARTDCRTEYRPVSRRRARRSSVPVYVAAPVAIQAGIHAVALERHSGQSFRLALSCRAATLHCGLNGQKSPSKRTIDLSSQIIRYKG